MQNHFRMGMCVYLYHVSVSPIPYVLFSFVANLKVISTPNGVSRTSSMVCNGFCLISGLKFPNIVNNVLPFSKCNSGKFDMIYANAWIFFKCNIIQLS